MTKNLFILFSYLNMIEKKGEEKKQTNGRNRNKEDLKWVICHQGSV